jgi:nucleotide-binding universal stress UspA family protein
MADDQRRIVVGVDGSEPSRLALRWAADEAKLRDATLEVVTAWHIPPQFASPAVPMVDYDFETVAGDTLAAEVAAVLGPDPGAIVHRVVNGHPARVLIELSEHAELLVVGSRGLGEFTGTLLGSVSRHCTTHAHCSVVVVRGNA